MNVLESMGTERKLHFIHIGFPKTATTLLQRRFFAVHPELHSVGKPAPGWQQLIAALKMTDTLCLKRKSLLSQMLRSRLHRIKNNIFSEEHLSVGIGQDGIRTFFDDRQHLAQRLHQLAPEAKILVTLRNQLDLLPSYFHLRHKFLGRENGRNYSIIDEWLHDQWEAFFSELDLFRFEETIALYEEVFGVDRIEVWFYEELVRNPRAFFSGVSRSLGVSENFITEGLWATRIARTRNKVGPEALTEEARERLEGLYRPGNQILAGRFGWPLEEWGYPC